MSKSLGNGALVSEVTARYPGRAVRYYLVAAHYRSAIEFDDSALTDAATALQRIDSFVQRAGAALATTPVAGPIPAAFAAAMDDDLNTAEAMAVLYRRVREGNSALGAGDLAEVARATGDVVAMLTVLGLDPAADEWAGQHPADTDLDGLLDELIGELLVQRHDARTRKDFAAADRLRDRLGELGVAVMDTADGPRWSLEGHHGR